MCKTFPAACFGKDPGQGGGSHYRMLSRSREFPDHAIQAFERLATSLQWLGGGGDAPYQDCFAAWPVGRDGVIVARFHDGGEDQFNRPHTLRVEGAWIAREGFPEWPHGVADLLQPAAWPDASDQAASETVALLLGRQNPQLGDTVRRAFERPELAKVLLASHRHYRADGFDIVQDPNRPNGAICPRSDPTRPGATSPAINQNAMANQTPRPRRRWILVTLVLAMLAVGLFAAWEHHLRRLAEREVDRVGDRLDDAEDSLKREEQQRSAAEGQRDLARKERDEARRALAATGRELEEYRGIIDRFDLGDPNALRARLEIYREKETPSLQQKEEQEAARLSRDQEFMEAIDKAIEALQHAKSFIEDAQ